jgi:hypothetical protein
MVLDVVRGLLNLESMSFKLIASRNTVKSTPACCMNVDLNHSTNGIRQILRNTSRLVPYWDFIEHKPILIAFILSDNCVANCKIGGNSSGHNGYNDIR